MGGSRVDGRLLLAYKADPILRNREGRLPSDLILCHDACVVEGCEAGDLMVIKSYRWYGSTIPSGWNIMPVLSCWILLEFWEFIYVPNPMCRCLAGCQMFECLRVLFNVNGLHCKLQSFFGSLPVLLGAPSIVTHQQNPSSPGNIHFHVEISNTCWPIGMPKPKTLQLTRQLWY